jgi:hypothetical protein
VNIMPEERFDMTPEPLTRDDLTPQQLAWMPEPGEVLGLWPHAWKVEVWDGAGTFSDYEGTWDWRSLVLATRTYPGWWPVLNHPGRLTVYPTKEAAVAALAKEAESAARYDAEERR